MAFFKYVLSKNLKKILMKQVKTDLQNEQFKEEHFQKRKQIQNNHLQKAMKITNQIFNVEDLNEPKSIQR